MSDFLRPDDPTREDLTMPETGTPDLVAALMRSVRREARNGAPHEHKWKVLGCARCRLEWKEDHA